MNQRDRDAFIGFAAGVGLTLLTLYWLTAITGGI